MLLRIGFAALATILISCAVYADVLPPRPQSDITILDAWARPTTASNGAAFFSVKNESSEGDTLLAVTCDIAKLAEIHEMKMDGMIMRMRKLAKREIPAHSSIIFAPPGGDHIMLIGLKAPLKTGEHFKLQLDFEKAGRIDVDVVVGMPSQKASQHP